MLPELLVYAQSRAATPPAFRRYLHDAVGLWARGRRQLHAWAPHLGKTLGVLDQTIDEIPGRRTVAVLGSGPLFDVPLESLGRTFRRVLLIDRAHLSVNNRRLGRYPNVERVWRDLAPEGEPAPLAFLADIPDLDWVISVNLVSQLGRAVPAMAARDVIDRHLDGLLALNCQATLVTDRDYRVFDQKGTLLEDYDLLHGRPMPPPESRWLWEVAPFGEEGPDTRRIHTVLAYPDWSAADRGSS